MVFPQLPYPPESGGRIVTFEMVRFLLQRHQVRIASLQHRSEDIESAIHLEKMGAKVTMEKAPSRKSVPRLLRSVFSDCPYKAHRFYSKQLDLRIQNHLNLERFDVIHAQNFYMAQYIKGTEPCRKVYYKENYEGLLLKRYAATLPNPVTRMFWQREAEKTSRFETNLGRRFDATLCISPADAERLRAASPDIDWQSIAPCINLDEHCYRRREQSPPMLLFLGMLNYFPNVDAAEYFVRKIFPAVRNRVSGVEVCFCGHSPDSRMQRLSKYPGVKVIGSVDDPSDFMERCSVFIIPLRIGGGVRLKLLQALAKGCAVVSTSIGSEGLAFEHRKHLLIADEPDAFADGVVQLLKDAALRESLGLQGHRQVEQHYSPSIVLPSLERVYLGENNLSGRV